MLSASSPHWGVYPEDIYPGGKYVNLPYGLMRYWRFGPEGGKKASVIAVSTHYLLTHWHTGYTRSWTSDPLHHLGEGCSGPS
jgi:hypothetical protein